MGGVSSSSSILYSCPIQTSNNPSGRSMGKISLYSYRTTLISSNMSLWYAFSTSYPVSVFSGTIGTILFSSSLTSRINTKYVSSTFLRWNHQATCFALHSLSVSILSFTCRLRMIGKVRIQPGRWIVMYLLVQSIMGFLYSNQGIPRMHSLCRLGNTLATILPL